MAQTPEAVQVDRTGIAVVHKDEVVVSAPDATAVLRRIVVGEGGSVHLYFPVEIVVTGGIPEHEKRQLRDDLLEELDDWE